MVDCFELHGYPAWYKGRRGKDARNQSRGGVQPGRGQANAAATRPFVGSNNNTRIPSLSTEQFQKLLTMLDRSSNSTEKLSSKNYTSPTWILDSEASSHMTGRKELLRELKDTASMLVSLPNGAKTVSTIVGRARLSPKIALTDVFYVPNITCNLISIRQLIYAINCQITFANALCVVQDRTSKMLIGAGELSRGRGVRGLLLQAYSIIFGNEGTSRSVFDLAQALATSE